MREKRGLIASIGLLALSFCFYFTFFKTDNFISGEPYVLLFLSSLILITSIVYSKDAIILNSLENTCLFFLLFLLIKSCVVSIVNISTIGYLVLIFLLYLSFKKVSLSITNHWQYYIGSVLFILLLFLIFSMHHCYIKKGNLDNFYFPNKTILGIVIASQLSFLLPYFKLQFTGNKFVKYISVAIILGGVILLIATNSRSAWLGMVAALLILFYCNIKNIKHKKYVKVISIILFLVSLTSLFFYKPNSSNGRVLIYKVSTQMLKDNWLWGIGTGNYKVQYNNYQAQYFSTHSIDSKEAMLADNTYYAFNDYFQLIIENGMGALLFLVGFVVLLYKKIKKLIASSNQFAKGLSSAAICILIASLFSYPLQFLPLAVQLLFCLAIINTIGDDKKANKSIKYTNPILVVLSLLCLVHYGLYFKYRLQVEKAGHLSKIGYKTMALKNYAALNGYYFKEGNVLYKYAQELYYTNRLTEAKKVIEETQKVYTSHELSKLSASIDAELQNYIEAEKEYKKAIYMAPNRMLSRKEILDFYISQKDTVNSIFWAKSILYMPVKIPSNITVQTLLQTREILLQFHR